jgi:hypothetical protein
MKFATGPATTIAAPNRLEEEAVAPFRLAHLRQRLLVGGARDIVVAEEFNIAAKRYRGDLPARAAAVVEADEFRSEPDRECQHAHAAPARDEEMPQLMKEDDDRKIEQERQDPAGQAAAPDRHLSLHQSPHAACRTTAFHAYLRRPFVGDAGQCVHPRTPTSAPTLASGPPFKPFKTIQAAAMNAGADCTDKRPS